MTAQRVLPVAAVAAMSLLAWAFLIAIGHDLPAAPREPVHLPWSPAGAVLAFAMWWVMMIGMMLPSALPMIVTFSTVNARRRARGDVAAPTALFVAGYLLAWGSFSALATGVQWLLEGARLMAPMHRLYSPVLGGLLFVAAGLYQFTPLKQACLRHCRSPLDFVLNHWREGRRGAMAMGLSHGSFCLGCCAGLMALLFSVGVMNLAWVALLAAFVLFEKLFPAPRWIAGAGGAGAIAFGLWLIAH